MYFAQSYSFTTNSTYSSTSGGVSAVLVVIYLLVIVIVLAGMWKVYLKAGQAGWKAIIPIYNIFIFLKIIGRPMWWFVLLIIPFVNIIFGIIVANDMSKSFGKGVGTTLLLIFLPFIGYPMLGFGNAKYVGPAASGGSKPAAPAAPAAGPATPAAA